MSDAHRLAGVYNQRRTRDDVEWFVAPNGEVMLRDNPEWVAKRNRERAESAERDRKQFNHRQKFPVQEAADA